MKLGALLGPVDPDNPKSLGNQAAELEAGGYDSLWVAQAVGRGSMFLDPFIALSIAASATRDAELGTAVLQLPLYHPADIALKSFSLMQVSGNRLSLGIGAGSTEIDHAIHGASFEARFRRFNSDLIQLRQWFESGEVDGHAITPWSCVKGGPKLMYGTWGKGVERAAGEFDAWIASGNYRSPEELQEAMNRFRQAGGQRAIVSTILINDETDLGELQVRLQKYQEIGFDDAVVMFLPGAPGIDAVRRLAES